MSYNRQIPTVITTSTELQAIIDKNLAMQTVPFPFHKVGSMRLKRSTIPKEKCERVIFHLDTDTIVVLQMLALQRKLTFDEYMRNVCWSLAS